MDQQTINDLADVLRSIVSDLAEGRTVLCSVDRSTEAVNSFLIVRPDGITVEIQQTQPSKLNEEILWTRKRERFWWVS